LGQNFIHKNEYFLLALSSQKRILSVKANLNQHVKI